MLGRIADRMEFFLNSMEVYLAIGIVGTVISFLYGMFGELGEMRLAFFLTVWIMATIRILTEKRYFKRYDAIPSSSQFIVLPFLLSLYLQAFGNVMPSPFIEQSSWSISEYMIFITGGSIMIFPHIIFQWYIFDKVHSKKWLGFAVHRKLFMTRKVPFAVHAIMTVTMTYLIWTSKKMEITAVFSIFFWIFMTARHYFHKSRPQNISQNRGYLSNPVISDYLRRPSRQSRRRREIIQQSNVRRMQSPSQPTSTRREKKRSSRGNVQPTLRINRHLVEIDQGTEIKIESKKRKRKKANGTSSKFTIIC